MFIKFLSRFSAGHSFYSHREQKQFEIEMAMRKEKVMASALFSF